MDNLFNNIEETIRRLGYSFDSHLSDFFKSLDFSKKQYRALASISFKAIKISTELNDFSTDQYRTHFVNQMKSTLVKNNRNFRDFLDKGLYRPFGNKHNHEVSFFNKKNLSKNLYTYTNRLSLKYQGQEAIVDYVLSINGFPLITINSIEDDVSLEDYIDLYYDVIESNSTFYSVNVFNLFLYRDKVYLGTIYDFLEDFLVFEIDNLESQSKNLNLLYFLLCKANVLNYITKNKLARDYIDVMLSEDYQSKAANYSQNFQSTKEDLGNPEIDKISINTNFNQNEAYHLAFLDDSSLDMNLEERIRSKQFQERQERLVETPDYTLNREYISEIKNSDDPVKKKRSLNLLLEANEKLVSKFAGKYSYLTTKSMDIDDIKQDARIGLLKSVNKFDLDLENEFSTYSVYWIKQNIMRSYINNGLTIRLPAHRHEDINKLNRLEKESKRRFNTIDYQWISDEMGLTRIKLDELISVRNTFWNLASLDVPVGVDQETTLGSFLEDESTDVEQEVMDNELSDAINSVLESLSNRENEIIKMRFGFYDGTPKTLEEIGQVFGVTRERIRQIESKAISKLKHSTRNKYLIDFWED